MDTLMNTYYELAGTQIIPSIADYAQDWRNLAGQFDAAGRPSMAAMCLSRAEYYARQAAGEYIRIIEGPLSELIPTEA